MEARRLTQRGLVRRTNEDGFIVAPDVGLFVAAEGVGGNATGEVASRVAVDTLLATGVLVPIG